MFPYLCRQTIIKTNNKMKKLFFFLALLLPIGAWADETVIAERDWTGPSWFNGEGTDATCGMTAEGVTITNPIEQSDYWTPQMCIVDGITLQEGHTYKVLITAKVPSGGVLYVQLGSWEDDRDYNIYYDQDVDVEASSEFKEIEVFFYGFPADTKKGHVVFQTGYITGTCTVKNVQVFDITDEEKIIKELDLTGPLWFKDEGTGATCGMTTDGVTITNPAEQSQYWTPQMSVLDNFKLKKYHSYKVVINAKIPSNGLLMVQLGIWGDTEEENIYEDVGTYVEASEEFQDLEFTYNKYPANSEKCHVLFQNGLIPGTCTIKSIKVIDLDADLGDANNDGQVDKEDITSLADLILSDTYYTKADMNKDGKANAADIVLLTNEINKE